MAVTQMANMINPEVMGDMISAKIEALAKITPYAKVDTTLQGVAGDTKTVPKWAYIGDAEDIAEGAEVGLTEMTSSSTTFSIKKAMKAVGLTQEAINSGYGDPVGQAESQLAKSIAGKIDNDVFASALTSTVTSGDATAKIAYSGIVDGVGTFVEEEVTEKVMFVHPSQVTTLRKDSDFISADKYDNKVMMTGEIGMIAGIRVIPSKKVPLIEYTLEASSGTGIVKVVASGASTGEVNLSAVSGKKVWDATNKKVVEPAVDDYIKAVTNNYYMNPILKLQPENAETDFTETELPAITIFLKKEIQTDAEWKPRTQTHEITTAKYYGVALTNEAKVVVCKFKAQ